MRVLGQNWDLVEAPPSGHQGSQKDFRSEHRICHKFVPDCMELVRFFLRGGGAFAATVPSNVIEFLIVPPREILCCGECALYSWFWGPMLS